MSYFGVLTKIKLQSEHVKVMHSFGPMLCHFVKK